MKSFEVVWDCQLPFKMIENYTPGSDWEYAKVKCGVGMLVLHKGDIITLGEKLMEDLQLKVGTPNMLDSDIKDLVRRDGNQVYIASDNKNAIDNSIEDGVITEINIRKEKLIETLSEVLAMTWGKYETNISFSKNEDEVIVKIKL